MPLNPHKQQARRADEVERTLTTAPAAVVKKRDGSSFDLATLWQDKTVVIYFYRGGWCPHCKKQLAELQQNYKAFDEAQAIVVAVSNEPGEAATALRTQLALGFELYSDPELEMIAGWGVQDYSQGIAKPAAFIVEPGGAIRYRKVGDTATDQPSVDELLAALR